jgi:hypothetical protein
VYEVSVCLNYSSYVGVLTVRVCSRLIRGVRGLHSILGLVSFIIVAGEGGGEEEEDEEECCFHRAVLLELLCGGGSGGGSWG